MDPNHVDNWEEVMEALDEPVDSGIGSDFDDLESINSLNYHFEVRGNRRFHGMANNPYFLPNDQEELNRLDELHFVLQTAYGENIIAPIAPSNCQNQEIILDVGTGTGRWAIEVADERRFATVIGLDISPIQPFVVPGNCGFVVGDLVDGFECGDDSVDLVHSRLIQSGVVKDAWDPYIREIFRVLKPDCGWAQVGELFPPSWEKGSVPEGSYFAQFRRYLLEVLEEKNLMTGGEHLEQRFRDAGFVDIQVLVRRIDIGDWQGSGRRTASARRARAALMCAIEPFVQSFTTRFPNEKERTAFGKKVLEECRTADYPLFHIMHTVIARKPAREPIDPSIPKITIN